MLNTILTRDYHASLSDWIEAGKRL